MNDTESTNIEVINKSIGDADVTFYGDLTTISQVVQLLAYIRHAIQNNEEVDISVKIGHKVVNTPFSLTVNGQQVQDYVTQKEVEIN